MSDGPEGEREDTALDHRRNASDALHEIVSNSREFVRHSWTAVDSTLQDHPVIYGTIKAGFFTGMVGAVGFILGWLYTFFFGAVADVSRDLSVTTFPLPIGLSLWLVLGISLLALVYSWSRVVRLRDRVEELESNR